MSLILVSTFVAFFVYLVQQYLKNKEKFKWLESLQGVPSANIQETFSSILKFFSGDTTKVSDLHPDVYMFQKMYGTSVLYRKPGMYYMWLGSTPIVVLQSPESIEKVLSSNVSLDKSFDYDFVLDWIGRGLITSKASTWKSRRRLLTPCFHFRILDDFLPVFNEQSMVLMENFRSQAEKEFVDITPMITMCTLDIVCQTVMGVQIGAQSGKNPEYVDALQDFGEALLKRTYTPWMWNSFVFSLTEMGRRYKKDLATLHNFTKTIIKQKKKELLEEAKSKRKKSEAGEEEEIGTKKKKALMDLLLGMQIEGEDLADGDIQEEIDTFMFAGHDTTAAGITFALYCIGLYPDIQNKLNEEIESIFGEDKERHVTMDDVRNLKYLECVLKETQRVYPSVPAVGRVLGEDIHVDGKTIPKGTTVNIMSMAMHNNPNIFPEPEKFDPDRFLPENCANRHPYSYVPFSAGPRNCIGMRFAILEEKVIVCNILRHLRIQSLDPRDKFHVKQELILKPAGPVRVKFMPK